jgi:hypothetical protein
MLRGRHGHDGMIYDFRLLLWYLQTFHLAIVLSVLFRFTDSDYSFGIFTLFLHEIESLQGVLDTTLCDKVCQWFALGM